MSVKVEVIDVDENEEIEEKDVIMDEEKKDDEEKKKTVYDFTEQQAHRLVNDNHPEQLPVYRQLENTKAVPIARKCAKFFKLAQGTASSAKVLFNACQGILELQENFRPRSFSNLLEWIGNHYPSLKFTPDKVRALAEARYVSMPGVSDGPHKPTQKRRLARSKPKLMSGEWCPLCHPGMDKNSKNLRHMVKIHSTLYLVLYEILGEEEFEKQFPDAKKPTQDLEAALEQRNQKRAKANSGVVLRDEDDDEDDEEPRKEEPGLVLSDVKKFCQICCAFGKWHVVQYEHFMIYSLLKRLIPAEKFSELHSGASFLGESLTEVELRSTGFEIPSKAGYQPEGTQETEEKIPMVQVLMKLMFVFGNDSEKEVMMELLSERLQVLLNTKKRMEGFCTSQAIGTLMFMGFEFKPATFSMIPESDRPAVVEKLAPYYVVQLVNSIDPLMISTERYYKAVFKERLVDHILEMMGEGEMPTRDELLKYVYNTCGEVVVKTSWTIGVEKFDRMRLLVENIPATVPNTLVLSYLRKEGNFLAKFWLGTAEESTRELVLLMESTYQLQKLCYNMNGKYLKGTEEELDLKPLKITLYQGTVLAARAKQVAEREEEERKMRRNPQYGYGYIPPYMGRGRGGRVPSLVQHGTPSLLPDYSGDGFDGPPRRSHMETAPWPPPWESNVQKRKKGMMGMEGPNKRRFGGSEDYSSGWSGDWNQGDMGGGGYWGRPPKEDEDYYPWSETGEPGYMGGYSGQDDDYESPSRFRTKFAGARGGMGRTAAQGGMGRTAAYGGMAGAMGGMASGMAGGMAAPGQNLAAVAQEIGSDLEPDEVKNMMVMMMMMKNMSQKKKQQQGFGFQGGSGSSQGGKPSLLGSGPPAYGRGRGRGFY